MPYRTLLVRLGIRPAFVVALPGLERSVSKSRRQAHRDAGQLRSCLNLTDFAQDSRVLAVAALAVSLVHDFTVDDRDLRERVLA